MHLTIKNILLHVDSSSACPTRVDAALKFAHCFGAQITALYVIPEITVPTYTEVYIGPELIEQGKQAAREQMQQQKSTYEEAARRADVALEWRSAEGRLVSTLNQHARYSDLVILGQGDPNDHDDISTGLADDVLLGSGVPCLVIPYIGVRETCGNKILVAWNASRESARAVRDGLPLMSRAESVDVLVMNPDDGDIDEGDIPSADISRHLARHDIKVEAHTAHNSDIDAGDALLSYAADVSADLIIMGGYGHSRLRETILGGVTRHLLRHMTVPVLMSH